MLRLGGVSRLVFILFTMHRALHASEIRLNQEISSSNLAPLHGSVSPSVLAKFDIGRRDSGSQLHGMTLHLQLSVAQKAELDALVRQQFTPGSTQYHHWLTPEGYAERFGLSDQDLSSIQSWLEQQGFVIDRISRSRTSVVFSGTVGQVESAFKTEIHNYRVDGREHFANATELQLPEALAGVVGAIRNLNDFRPRSYLRRNTNSHTLRPEFTSSQSGNHYLTPKDVAVIYDVNAAYNAGYTGTGQSIAIVGQSEISAADIENFQNAAGLPVKDPAMVLVPSSGTAAVSSGDEAESDLDLEYSGAIAKGATIYFVYVGNNSNYSIWDSIQYAVDTNIAPIISVSYGSCETDLSSSDFSTLEAIMEQGASQGQSIIVASGDVGSTGCYGDSSLTTSQQEALSVDYPASSAYVTGLGGTEFPDSAVSSSNTTYWESTGSSDLVSSAKSYIPEQVWNDDSSSSGLSSGGGGVSSLTARPSWQKGVTGIASGSYRLLPDISLSSSPNNAGYLYCSSDSNSTGITGSCSNGFRDSNSQYLTVAGGTSFAAPIFAGMLAIISQQENSTGLGLINKTLYTLAADSSAYASAFHDITSGSNACTAGSSYCSSAGASEYSAGVGYDEATGLGSIDLSNLMSAWPSSSSASLLATTTSLSAASASPSSGAGDVITIKVSSQSTSTSTPTGTLAIGVDGTQETSSLAVLNGTATYTFSSTASGSHVITATYSGDSTFASSSGSVTVSVGGSSSGSSGGTFTLSAGNITVSQGSSASSTVTVTSQNSYAGSVSFTLSTSDSSLTSYGCYSISDATVSAGQKATTTLTVYTSTSICNSSTSVKGSERHRFAPRGRYDREAILMDPDPWNSISGIALIPLIGLFGFRGPRRKWLWSSICLFAVALQFVTGCSSTSGSSVVPKGTYSLTLDGSDTSNSSITASTTLKVTVD